MDLIMYNKVLSKLLLVILIAIVLTRIWAISLFYIFANNPAFMERILTDSWHHYQVGLVLVVAGIVLYKFKIPKTLTIIAIGLGIFLEEWAIVFHDFGFNTKALYMTMFDFIVISGGIGLLYLLAKIHQHKYLNVINKKLRSSKF